MKTCLKCGGKFPDDAMFCSYCGFEDVKFCRDCGKERIPGTVFCAFCGKKYYMPEQAAESAETPAAPAAEDNTAPVEAPLNEKSADVMDDILSAIAPLPAAEESSPSDSAYEEFASPEQSQPVKPSEKTIVMPAITEKPAVPEDPLSAALQPDAPVTETVIDPLADVLATLEDKKPEPAPVSAPQQISEYTSASELIQTGNTAPAAAPVQNTLTAKKKKLPIVPIAAGAAVVVAAVGVGIYFISTTTSRKYKSALKALDSGEYEAAITQFEALGDYEDSKERVEKATLMMHYDNGKKAFYSGDYEKAKEEFKLAGNYNDAEDMVKESELAGKYAHAVSLSVSGDYTGAIEEFNRISDYKDAAVQIKKCYFEMAEAALAGNKLDEATEYYKQAGDYPNASEKLSEINYMRAEGELAAGNDLGAADFFYQAGSYKDAADRAKQIYYKLGTDAFSKKNYDKSADYLKMAGDYQDAATQVQVAAYNAAAVSLKTRNYEKAGLYLSLAGTYKNADQALIKTIQNLVKAKDYDNAKKVALNYSGENAEEWNNYISGMISFSNKDFAAAADSFKAAGEFMNSQVCYQSSKYNQGLKLLKEKSFNDAKAAFSAAGSYKFAYDLSIVCNAEGHYAEGHVLKASQLYAKVNKKVKVSEFNIWSRKAYIDARLTLIRASGDWTGKANTITSKVVEDYGYSHMWRSTELWSDQYITFKYEMNDNGTFNFEFTLSFGRYTNYSYYSYDLTSDRVTVTKKFKNQKKLPSSIKLSNNVTLKYSKSTFTVVYTKTERSGASTYQYTSTVSYRKLE
ncbi:MAG: hypothetical protein K5869_12495 [Saccharofermentans sp.]|nr:hypothetical protein [Saccharofermentans sp.]